MEISTKNPLGLTELTVASQVARFIQDGITLEDSAAQVIAVDNGTDTDPGMEALGFYGRIDATLVRTEILRKIESYIQADPTGVDTAKAAHAVDTTAALFALLGYVVRSGDRAAVDGWAGMTTRQVVSRYSEDSPHRTTATYPWGSEAGMAELIARQRSNYIPVFNAYLDSAESELVLHIASVFEPQPGQVPAEGWFAGGMLVTYPNEEGYQMYAWHAGDFAALVYALRWFSEEQRHEAGQRDAARLMLTEIAGLLGVTFADPAAKDRDRT